ncbi:hypothetical protein, partial [Gelidibacter algens]|uniref:hypothetical protein n=1 Tax=Gelidibacter algens TaxID=49280 RepID=UPI001B8782F2
GSCFPEFHGAKSASIFRNRPSKNISAFLELSLPLQYNISHCGCPAIGSGKARSQFLADKV